MRVTVRRALAALGTAVSALACNDGSGPESDSNARVTVRLTDAPGEIKAAVVTISEIYLQGGAEGRVTLRSDPVTTNLISLANDAAVLVDDAEVPEDSYSELRFVITGGYIEVENNQGGTSFFASSPTYAGLPAGAQVTGELQMPSLGSSGLKVQFDDQADLAITGDQDLLVDFDVAQSFGHQAGNSGKWVMHPVVKGARASLAATVVATMRLGSAVTLPSVGGQVVTLAAFKADLNGEMIPFTDADGDGVFEARFRFLLPGDYTLTLIVPAGVTVTTNPSVPIDLDAAAGAQATVALTIISAAAG